MCLPRIRAGGPESVVVGKMVPIGTKISTALAAAPPWRAHGPEDSVAGQKSPLGDKSFSTLVMDAGELFQLVSTQMTESDASKTSEVLSNGSTFLPRK